MKRALISPNENAHTGKRVAQVVAQDADFPVAPPMFFIDCPDAVAAETHFFDGAAFQLIPPPAATPPTDLSSTDDLPKVIKALALCIAQVGGLTPAQIKTMFKNKYDGLP